MAVKKIMGMIRNTGDCDDNEGGCDADEEDDGDDDEEGGGDDDEEGGGDDDDEGGGEVKQASLSGG